MRLQYLRSDYIRPDSKGKFWASLALRVNSQTKGIYHYLQQIEIYSLLFEI